MARKFVLPETHDPLICELWTWGWDTARIAIHIDAVRQCKGRPAEEAVFEEDVYNVLDRAFGRTESDTVKAS
jgi:hypothetical protein